MARNLNGVNITSYLGVNAPTPPNLVRIPRIPTSHDTMSGNLGTIWVDSSVNPPSSQNIYMLMSVAEGEAVWVSFGGNTGVVASLTGDFGVPVFPDVNGNINVVGSSLINTIGVANTLGIRFNEGLDGQIPIAADGAPTQYANITSTDNSVNIINGPNSIDLEVVSGSETINEITTDAGTATPIAGNINMVGGELINTSAAGDTVTINLNRGTDGQIPIAATGAATQYANITSSDMSITITNTANGIDIVNSGLGGAGVTVTTFTSSGTWTKGAGTRWVHVYGWSGGGGGGGGNYGTANLSTGGSGGSGGLVFDLEAPGVQFGATEPIIIGAGGLGGASRNTIGSGNAGAAGGMTSMGNIKPYVENSAGVGGSSSATSWALQPKIIRGWEFIYPAMPTNTGFGGTGSMTNSIYKGGGAPGGTSAGTDGTDRGYWNNGFGQNFTNDQISSSSGGGGGGARSSGTVSGGRAGNINSYDSTLILAGGAGGTDGGSIDGSAGNSRTGVTGGMMIGSTGGGGGCGQLNQTRGGDGGVGAVPGAGGGGGGGAKSGGTRSGAGGNGADGMIIVIEFA